MNSPEREKVLNKLRAANQIQNLELPPKPKFADEDLSVAGKIGRFKQLMEAVHTEVYPCTSTTWFELFLEQLQQKKIKSLCYAPETELGQFIAKHWKNGAVKLIPYANPIEEFKSQLFETGAAITTTVGGIAETGSLILWPNPREPRLMSLVPPVHFAVLKANHIYTSFTEAIEALNWTQKAPANAILISGPSKTADIELTLAYEVHGPGQLVVFILKDSF